MSCCDTFNRLCAGTGTGCDPSSGGVASVTAGTGISVGGTLTNPSVAIADIGSAGTYAYPSSVTTNAQGQVTAITAGSNYPYIWQFGLFSEPYFTAFGEDVKWNTSSLYQNTSTNMITDTSSQTIALTGFYQINFRPFIIGSTIDWQLSVQSNGIAWADGNYVSNMSASTITAIRMPYFEVR